ncbi:MAG: DinB family protein [Chloroflexi bacterium]|nr:DinB family protein [Chloroflexota bacterium]
MNAADVLKYGHLTVMRTIDGLALDDWDRSGVCGWWSVRQIIAHLASHESLLVEVLGNLIDSRPAPGLAKYLEMGLLWNDYAVEQREHLSAPETLAEYCDAHAQVISLITQIPVEKRRQPGILPWYGAEYDLEDYLAYGFYGHKREHCAQISVYRDTLNDEE